VNVDDRVQRDFDATCVAYTRSLTVWFERDDDDDDDDDEGICRARHK